MAEYRITNRTHGAVRVEDLGITLQRGESRNVPEGAFLASRDVRAHASWLHVEKVNEAPMRIWPFSRPAVHQAPAAAPAPAPPQPVPPQLPPPSPDVAQLNESMRELTRRVAELTSALASVGGVQPSAAHAYGHAQAPVRQGDHTGPAEPVYIPSVIVPKDAEVRIKAKEEETQRDDFDESANALKNLRRQQRK